MSPVASAWRLDYGAVNGLSDTGSLGVGCLQWFKMRWAIPRGGRRCPSALEFRAPSRCFSGTGRLVGRLMPTLASLGIWAGLLASQQYGLKRTEGQLEVAVGSAGLNTGLNCFGLANGKDEEDCRRSYGPFDIRRRLRCRTNMYSRPFVIPDMD